MKNSFIKFIKLKFKKEKLYQKLNLVYLLNNTNLISTFCFLFELLILIILSSTFVLTTTYPTSNIFEIFKYFNISRLIQENIITKDISIVFFIFIFLNFALKILIIFIFIVFFNEENIKNIINKLITNNNNYKKDKCNSKESVQQSCKYLNVQNIHNINPFVKYSLLLMHFHSKVLIYIEIQFLLSSMFYCKEPHSYSINYATLKINNIINQSDSLNNCQIINNNTGFFIICMLVLIIDVLFAIIIQHFSISVFSFDSFSVKKFINSNYILYTLKYIFYSISSFIISFFNFYYIFNIKSNSKYNIYLITILSTILLILLLFILINKHQKSTTINNLSYNSNKLIHINNFFECFIFSSIIFSIFNYVFILHYKNKYLDINLFESYFSELSMFTSIIVSISYVLIIKSKTFNYKDILLNNYNNSNNSKDIYLKYFNIIFIKNDSYYCNNKLNINKVINTKKSNELFYYYLKFLDIIIYNINNIDNLNCLAFLLKNYEFHKLTCEDNNSFLDVVFNNKIMSSNTIINKDKNLHNNKVVSQSDFSNIRNTKIYNNCNIMNLLESKDILCPCVKQVFNQLYSEDINNFNMFNALHTENNNIKLSNYQKEFFSKNYNINYIITSLLNPSNSISALDIDNLILIYSPIKDILYYYILIMKQYKQNIIDRYTSNLISSNLLLTYFFNIIELILKYNADFKEIFYLIHELKTITNACYDSSFLNKENSHYMLNYKKSKMSFKEELCLYIFDNKIKNLCNLFYQQNGNINNSNQRTNELIKNKLTITNINYYNCLNSFNKLNTMESLFEKSIVLFKDIIYNNYFCGKVNVTYISKLMNKLRINNKLIIDMYFNLIDNLNCYGVLVNNIEFNMKFYYFSLIFKNKELEANIINHYNYILKLINSNVTNKYPNNKILLEFTTDKEILFKFVPLELINLLRYSSKELENNSINKIMPHFLIHKHNCIFNNILFNNKSVNFKNFNNNYNLYKTLRYNKLCLDIDNYLNSFNLIGKIMYYDKRLVFFGDVTIDKIQNTNNNNLVDQEFNKKNINNNISPANYIRKQHSHITNNKKVYYEKTLVCIDKQGKIHYFSKAFQDKFCLYYDLLKHENFTYNLFSLIPNLNNFLSVVDYNNDKEDNILNMLVNSQINELSNINNYSNNINYIENNINRYDLNTNKKNIISNLSLNKKNNLTPTNNKQKSIYTFKKSNTMLVNSEKNQIIIEPDKHNKQIIDKNKLNKKLSNYFVNISETENLLNMPFNSKNNNKELNTLNNKLLLRNNIKRNSLNNRKCSLLTNSLLNKNNKFKNNTNLNYSISLTDFNEKIINKNRELYYLESDNNIYLKHNFDNINNKIKDNIPTTINKKNFNSNNLVEDVFNNGFIKIVNIINTENIDKYSIENTNKNVYYFLEFNVETCEDINNINKNYYTTKKNKLYNNYNDIRSIDSVNNTENNYLNKEKNNSKNTNISSINRIYKDKITNCFSNKKNYTDEKTLFKNKYIKSIYYFNSLSNYSKLFKYVLVIFLIVGLSAIISFGIICILKNYSYVNYSIENTTQLFEFIVLKYGLTNILNTSIFNKYYSYKYTLVDNNIIKNRERNQIVFNNLNEEKDYALLLLVKSLEVNIDNYHENYVNFIESYYFNNLEKFEKYNLIEDESTNYTDISSVMSDLLNTNSSYSNIKNVTYILPFLDKIIVYSVKDISNLNNLYFYYFHYIKDISGNVIYNFINNYNGKSNIEDLKSYNILNVYILNLLKYSISSNFNLLFKGELNYKNKQYSYKLNIIAFCIADFLIVLVWIILVILIYFKYNKFNNKFYKNIFEFKNTNRNNNICIHNMQHYNKDKYSYFINYFNNLNAYNTIEDILDKYNNLNTNTFFNNNIENYFVKKNLLNNKESNKTNFNNNTDLKDANKNMINDSNLRLSIKNIKSKNNVKTSKDIINFYKNFVSTIKNEKLEQLNKNSNNTRNDIILESMKKNTDKDNEISNISKLIIINILLKYICWYSQLKEKFKIN